MNDETNGGLIKARTFLSAMWPTTSLHHQLATMDRRGAPGMRHTEVHDLSHSLAEVGEWVNGGLDCYFACAEFRNPGSRKAENAVAAAAFWMDIDCSASKAGAGTGYATSEEAIGALETFCRESGLPEATHINESGGGGIHVFWIMDRAIDAEEWKRHANRLKELARLRGLHADPTRTADIASVLRVPGTLNHKSEPPGLVRVVRSGELLCADSMLRALEQAHAQVPRNTGDIRTPTSGPGSLHATPEGELRRLLLRIDPDVGYEEWVRVLMGLFTETAGSEQGLALAIDWSRNGKKFVGEAEVRKKWKSFRMDLQRPVGIGTLRMMAAHGLENEGTKTASVAAPRSALMESVRRAASEYTGPPTHGGYADAIIAQCTVGGWPPVAHESKLYVLDPVSNLWMPKPTEDLMRMTKAAFDNKPRCSRAADYKAIANLAVDLASDSNFFEGAAAGLACLDSFYQVSGDKVEVVPLQPSHRQRVKLDFAPTDTGTPLFNKFLDETFKSDRPGEKEEQLALLQEIVGAIMIGKMCDFHKAVLFHDPLGRAGKGTMERILRELVPKRFVTAVSPMRWNQEYYLMQLQGSRLNVVGELPETKRIPADSFKTVLGGDLLTGRHPNQRPVSFKNEAGHLFMSNSLIAADEHGEAFFARWLVVEFPNSRLRSGEPLDHTLPGRIINSEMPGIAYWALQGAQRVLRQKGFSRSAAHDRLIAASRRGNSSVEEFVSEECELGTTFKVRRRKFYEVYQGWCRGAGRQHLGSSRFYAALVNNIRLDIREGSEDGYDLLRGIQLKQRDIDIDPNF